jgi:SAM-dependent methyltransferase
MTNDQTRLYSYALATGSAGAERLALLEKVYGPHAERVLSSVDISTGARVVDFGCGTGATIPWFSRQIGEVGEVVGLDASAAQLAVAKQNCDTLGIANVRFVEASAYQSGLPQSYFDVAHCRLLLCHLQNPLDAIREMVSVVRPGGLVICFDLDLGTLYTMPRTACYDEMRDIYVKRREMDGLDKGLWTKLPALFLQSGLIDPEMTIIHPVDLRGEKKRLWGLSFFESMARTLEKKLLTLEQLEKLRGEVDRVNADDSIAVAHAAMPVCWARKPV